MNISLTIDLLKVVDHALKEKKYANRSEFMRELIREYHEKEKEKKERKEFDRRWNSLSEEEKDHYRMAEPAFKDWLDPDNDDIFITD